MIRYSYTNLVAFTFILGMLLSFSSCGVSEPGDKVESHLTLQLQLPENDTSGNETPVGRAGTPEGGDEAERKITSLKYFIFSSANTLEKYETVTISNGNPDNPMWDTSNNALRITLTTGNKDIYCIANWTDGVAGMTTLNGTTVTTQAMLNAFTRNHNNNMPANPPVMTGKKTVTLDGTEQQMSIDLKRQIAAVEIMPMISTTMVSMDANISIEGIKFRNMPQSAYLFPNTSGPAFTAWHQGANAYDGFTSSGRITATTESAAIRYQGKRFYIPEHYGTSTTATQMIIKAKYNGEDTYYKVELCAPGSFKDPSLGHTSYRVERNHIYRYYITIQGKGDSSDITSRSADSPGTSNIICKLEIK